MKLNPQYIISRYPIYLACLIIVLSYITMPIMNSFTLTQEEFELYAKIETMNKIHFLISEGFVLLFILFMVLHVISKNKTKDKYCKAHKLGIVILSLFPITNIIALTTSFDYTFYSSLVTQIGICTLSGVAIYLLIREKDGC